MAGIDVGLIWRWRCEGCDVLGWSGSKERNDQEIAKHWDSDHSLLRDLGDLVASSWPVHVYSLQPLESGAYC